MEICSDDHFEDLSPSTETSTYENSFCLPKNYSILSESNLKS